MFLYHLLSLPLGEVAERSEDGEGPSGPHGGLERERKPLSVTCGDSSPRGRAKGGQRRPPLHTATRNRPREFPWDLFDIKKAE